jgi:glycogen(starch) synthase
VREPARWPNHFEFVDAAIPLEWMQQNEHCLPYGEKTLREVAHSFGAELLHSSQFCYGAAELGIPKIVTAHSDVFSWARACRHPLESSAWLDQYRRLVQNGLDSADAVTAPTEWMLSALKEEFSLPPVSAVISNGRAMCESRPSKRQLRAVTAGRLWDPGKGLSILHALRPPMPIVIAGEQRCEDAAADIPQGVEMLGVLQREELFQVFRESAVYICASHYEPFGLAALEAALCGCAVLARDIPSLREVWGGGAACFRSADELSRLLAGFCQDPQQLVEAQRRAHGRARLYTRERMVGAFRMLYRCVLAGERESVA